MGGVNELTTAQKLRESVSKTGPWNYAWSELRLQAANELEALHNILAGIHKAVNREVSGTCTDDILDDFTVWIEHHAKVEQERNFLRTQNQELISQLKEASVLIEKIGTTGVERTDIILKAEQWLKNQP